MIDEISDYVRGCEMCQRNVTASGNKAGLVMPVPVPVPFHIWEDISMDFVGPLPLTARDHDAVLVVIGRLSKVVHFPACKSDINAAGVADLLVDQGWSLHRLAKSIDKWYPALTA